MSEALDYMNRTTNFLAPKVPGINASTLRPSIGCDQWRVSSGQKLRRNAQYRAARPMSGRASVELMPGAARLPKKQRKVSRIDPVGTMRASNLSALELLKEFA